MIIGDENMMLLYNRKRAYILIGVIVVLILLTIGASYALNMNKEEKNYTIDNDGLITSYAYPNVGITTPLELVKDENNIDIPTYTFTVKNTTNEETYYNILITLNENENPIDETLIPYIKVAVDKNEPVYLNAHKNDNTYEVYLNTINSKVAITHTIKIYLSNKDQIGNELLDINYH